MKRFIVEDSFWDIFNEARIGVIVCKGIDNNVDADLNPMLERAQTEAMKHVEKEVLTDNPVIKTWRDAFKLFKTKKGARASIEALLKRVKNGSGLSSINPLVDIYNSISLSYGFPCGGEDIDKFQGDLRLTKADGNESFIPLGSDKDSPPYPEEIVYKDEAGVVCRCLNWREASRTILTEDTKNAFLCIENIDGRDKEFEDALNELRRLCEEHLGGSYEQYIIDRSNPSEIIE